MYMTLSKARRLAQENYETYTDIDKLQKKRVLLRDAMIRADSIRAQEYGLLDEAIAGGFFRGATTHSTTGIVPADIWLALNLKTSLDEADKRLKELTQG